MTAPDSGADTRRQAVVAGVAVAALVIALLGLVWLRADRRPSVLLVVVDTMRADRLSADGYDRPTTPRMDAIAADGMRFERAYAPSSWTLPSVTSMLTGQLPSRHRVRSWVHAGVPDGAPYLPDFLREQGYATVAVMGNANLGADGFGRGFDLFVEARTEPKLARTGLPLYPSAADITDLAIEALDQLGDSRFFLYAHYMDPHAPYLLPEGADDPWADPGYGGYAATRLAEVLPLVGRRYTRVYPYFWSKIRPGDADDERRVRDLYDAKVAYADAEIGRLIDHLDGLGRGADTLVVVTSDHGEGLFEHGVREHEELPYEHQVRVPLVVRGPEIEPGRVVADPVELLDLPLALAERCSAYGAWTPPHTGGNGHLRAAIAGGKPRPAGVDSVVAEVYVADRDEQAVMALQDGHKLIRTADRDLLFDLASDPGERTDLADGPAPAWLPALEEVLDTRLGPKSSSPPDAPAPADVVTDPQQLERLRALGYVE